MSDYKFSTKIVHPGNEIDPTTGASSVPIYQASTFHHFSLTDLPIYDYARSGNPTRQALEDAIAGLEGGTRGFAFASGMAAISTVFLLLSAGDHVVVTEDVYGGTFRILTKVLARMNIETTFVDMTNLEQVKAAVRPNTKAIYIETPSNPTLKITDIAAVVAIAKAHGCLTMLDNTFMTPYHQRPLEHGVDIVIHSATKFIGGHSDVLAGLVVVKDKALGAELKLLQVAFGAVLGVQDCWLTMRGLKTLKVRMDQGEAGARRLAKWLSQHPQVKKVYYPGLTDHPGRNIHEGQSSGYGAVVSFELESGEKAKKVLEAVNIPLVAVSLGAVESILSYPAMMSHASMPREVRLERGITDGLLRFSVGLEDPEDLILDLEQALN